MACSRTTEVCDFGESLIPGTETFTYSNTPVADPKINFLILVQVVFVIFLLTVTFAVLIWYGMYDNPIDSVKLAQVSLCSLVGCQFNRITESLLNL